MADIANTTRRQALRSLSIFGMAATLPVAAVAAPGGRGEHGTQHLELAIKAYEEALKRFKMLPPGISDDQWEHAADASLDRAQDIFVCQCGSSQDVLRKATYILTSPDLIEFASTWDNGAHDILKSFLPGLTDDAGSLLHSVA